jgi:hypothetical protein
LVEHWEGLFDREIFSPAMLQKRLQGGRHHRPSNRWLLAGSNGAAKPMGFRLVPIMKRATYRACLRGPAIPLDGRGGVGARGQHGGLCPSGIFYRGLDREASFQLADHLKLLKGTNHLIGGHGGDRDIAAIEIARPFAPEPQRSQRRRLGTYRDADRCGKWFGPGPCDLGIFGSQQDGFAEQCFEVGASSPERPWRLDENSFQRTPGSAGLQRSMVFG